MKLKRLMAAMTFVAAGVATAHAVAAGVDPAIAAYTKTTGVSGNIIFIYQAFRNDRMHHRVQHRHIGIRTELQEMGRMPCQLRASWVRQNEFSAVLSRVFNERCSYRMIGNRIGANQENDIRISNIGEGI